MKKQSPVSFWKKKNIKGWMTSISWPNKTCKNAAILFCLSMYDNGQLNDESLEQQRSIQTADEVPAR